MAVWMPDERWTEYLLAWAREKLDIESFGPGAYPIGVTRGEEHRLAAVVVYHHRRGGNIEMSIASESPRWATPHVISFLLRWPFRSMDVRRVTAFVGKRNTRARRFVEGLGFAREGTLRQGFEGDDAVLYGMTRKWFERSRWARGEKARAA